MFEDIKPDYGYEMIEIELKIRRSVHISCLMQVIDEAKKMGYLAELTAKYYKDKSPKFGEVKE